MEYSNTTSKDGVLQTIEILLGMDDGVITGNSTLKSQMTGIINNFAYNEVVSEILKNDNSIGFWDDYNEGSSRLPVHYQNLTVTPGSEVDIYSLPTSASSSGLGSSDASSFLRLIGAYIKDSSGVYQILRPIDDEMYEESLDSIFATAGTPKFYKLIGALIKLYPAPASGSVTATNGLKIVFQRDKVNFTTSDTTKQPGFPSIYHPLLPLLTAEMYAGINSLKQRDFIISKKKDFMANLGWGITNRNKDIDAKLISRQSRTNPNYE